MDGLVPPYSCSSLKPLLSQAAQEKAKHLPKISITSREAADLVMLGIGGFTPLAGFMGYDDWKSVCQSMQMANGMFWPIPITVSVENEKASSIKLGEEILLVREEPIAILKVQEKYSIDKLFECKNVLKTIDLKHPGVKLVMEQGEVNLAGSVQVLSEGVFPSRYPGIYLRPAETRALFQKMGWKTIAAFQTRNPMHRSHEELVKNALKVCDGVLIHSLLGELKSDDIPADVRVKAIAALVEHYLDKKRVVQAGYPLDMRYAGPREALLHAIFRQNYGCSHLIVGRDHAGVGNYYQPYEAQEIFSHIPKEALAIKPLKMDLSFWCNECNEMATEKTCPHSETDRVLLSGTKLRELLRSHKSVPEHFSRPEVLKILQQYYQSI